MARTNTPSDPIAPTHAEIAERAYALFLERGGEPGHDVTDWLEAERQLANGKAKPPARPRARTRAPRSPRTLTPV